MGPLVWEDASSNHQLVAGAQVCKLLPVLVHLPKSLLPHDFFVARVVAANLGVKVAHEYGHILLPYSVENCLEVLVKILFSSSVSFVGA